jgi:cobalamin biosynthesis Mg chelatase CobN
MLNLTNTSLMRGDFDSSLESLDDAIDMVQELNEEEENTDNSGNDVSNGLEVESGNDETINDNGATRGEIIDDNVERSQECVQNARPGEVCALS